MIEKERLEELIEQGATIWFYEDLSGIEIIDLKETDYKYEIGVVDADDREHLLQTSISKYGKSIDDWWWFSGSFETKEELDWYKEFGCIERTERLELPTWEEFIKFGENSHYGFNEIKRFDNVRFGYCCRPDGSDGSLYIDQDGKTMFLTSMITKENYTLACRQCKELFLGEMK